MCIYLCNLTVLFCKIKESFAHPSSELSDSFHLEIERAREFEARSMDIFNLDLVQFNIFIFIFLSALSRTWACIPSQSSIHQSLSSTTTEILLRCVQVASCGKSDPLARVSHHGCFPYRQGHSVHSVCGHLV